MPGHRRYTEKVLEAAEQISKPQKYSCRIMYMKELNPSWFEMTPSNFLSHASLKLLWYIVAILSFVLARMSFFFFFSNFACPTYQKFPSGVWAALEFEVNLWKELGVDMKALNPDDWESKFGAGMQRDMHTFFALFVKHKNRHLWYLCIMESFGVFEGWTIWSPMMLSIRHVACLKSHHCSWLTA